MLPDIQLDRMTFEEMVNEAKNKIVSFYPEWTDFNYHDPGITLVELFAWRKEIQQYEMDHIGEEHKRKYLKLLGSTIRHRRGARCFVTAEVSSPCLIPEGCRLEASGVIFETTGEQILPGVSIICCLGWCKEQISFLDGERLELGQPFSFYPFGSKAKEGTCLYIGLSGALPVGGLLALTIQTEKQDGLTRNPADSGSIPLAKLEFSYWDGTGFYPVELIREETFGLLLDGQIVFKVNSRMKKRRVGEQCAYFLRVLLKESQYDAAPVISFLNLNTLRVQQKETVAKWLSPSDVHGKEILWCDHNLCAAGEVKVFAKRQGLFREIPILKKEKEEAGDKTRILLKPCEEAIHAETFWILAYRNEEWYRSHFCLGAGHGFPDESFALDEDMTSYEDFAILVEEADCPGVFRKWEKKEDLAGSGPEDRHFWMDSMTGRILFGNGIHGMAPEGRVLIVSYSRVLGSGGNVKAMRIQRFLDQDLQNLKVSNRWDAGGGQDEETVEAALYRVREELMEPKNLVTAQDYERMVKTTPGLCIESCRALFDTDGMTVYLMVKPYSREQRPGLTPAVIQNILLHLEKKRLLGTRIKILPPAYIKLSISVEAAVHPQYQEAEDTIRQAVREYLSALKEQFGGTVSYSGLYGYIDRLDCVAGVRSLMAEAKGNGVRRTPYGDLILPENGIADVIEVQCSCSIQV